MELLVEPTGTVRCLYSEELDLQQIGSVTIERGSHVEPTAVGQWTADLSPVRGPTLGPFESRSEALAEEQAWLLTHWLFPLF